MSDHYDEGRRSLDEVPAPDLWAEAQRRAADGSVVPLSVGGGRLRRPGRWLAVAAAAALVIGTVAVLVDDDGDQSVDTTPATEPRTSTTIPRADAELDGPTLRQTEWQLERSTIDGVPTTGHGSAFAFRQNDVLWSDGCNERRAEFTQEFSSDLQLTEITGTANPCPPGVASEAIEAVMSADPITVSYDGDLLQLSSGDTILTLRPRQGSSSTTAAPSPQTTTSTDGVTTTSTSGAEGVRGTVTAGPTCPVERADEPCPPQPLAVHIVAIDGAGQTVAETDSADDGTYAIALPVGRYTLRVDTDGPFPACPDTGVTVVAGTQAVADIDCDTGIR